jgi:hypothetical protein
MFGCISHHNTDDGVDSLYYNTSLINCVLDGNGDDGYVHYATTDLIFTAFIGCRITNHSGSGDIGLNASNRMVIGGHNYFENNDGGNVQNGGVYYELPLEGGSTGSDVEDQSDTDYGYVDSANHDFSTDYADATDPSIRRRAITIPWT